MMSKKPAKPKESSGVGGSTSEHTFCFEEYELFKDMEICDDCAEIRGLLRLRGGEDFLLQECACLDKPGALRAREELKQQLRLDLGQAVSLCACCALALIKSGAEDSPLFCELCQVRIEGFNKRMGFAFIPITRRAALSGPGSKDVIRSIAPARKLNLIFDWRRAVLRVILLAPGRGEELSRGLFAYLREVPQGLVASCCAAEGLGEFFLKSSKALSPCPGRPGRVEAEDVFRAALDKALNRYTPGYELRCIFYSLVVRNEALKNKWPGGMEDYWERFAGGYNDTLTTTCFMGPYYDEHVTELKANRFVPRKDYIIFDASDVILKKNHAPFPFSVGWLEGYVHNAGVMVYLKQ